MANILDLPDTRIPRICLAICGTFFLTLAGCTSSNDTAKLSETDWTAVTLVQDGKSTDLAAQKSELSLLRNGTFRWTKAEGQEQKTLNGTYELSAGNQVVLTLKDEVEGSKIHVGELILSQDQAGKPTKLILRDTQGTIEFAPKK